jgi:hypothetical protein
VQIEIEHEAPDAGLEEVEFDLFPGGAFEKLVQDCLLTQMAGPELALVGEGFGIERTEFRRQGETGQRVGAARVLQERHEIAAQ